MDDIQNVPNPQGEGMPTPPVEEEKKPEGEMSQPSTETMAGETETPIE